jgi:C_GCAxxG_C_C family probable redox protein
MNTQIDFERIRNLAEEYYRSGDFYCSESIVKTIKDEFQLPISDDVIAAASGFPVGMGGAGCTCGAVAGGIMALGLFFGRTEAKDGKVNHTMALTKELHNEFKNTHRSLCCRVLTKDMELGSQKHMEQCISFTGEVAEKVARMIIRELDKKTA